MGLSVIVLALLAYRMTIGVDLSDESCYATFLDGWLKDGLGHSENLVVHQSSALLLLPAAQLYAWVAGSERGLVLFLRFIFLAMAGVASLCQYWFISRIRGKPVALSSALLVLCFIPFSLPAPSYNTIGMFGIGILERDFLHDPSRKAPSIAPSVQRRHAISIAEHGDFDAQLAERAGEE